MKHNIKNLAGTNFIVRRIVKENHFVNVRALSNIFKKGGRSNFSMLHRNYYSKRTCFFFNTVHLVKNIRKNFLNSKKLMFPAFEFIDFNFQC